ncbi:MAG: type II toxin-antitoxin system HicA family toxin [Rhodanobacteraceae bacterium]|nr:MAG: type II toxin-antitoxin system HicA family toxin [Rhodanobacteraceae bacterium]
MKRRDLLKHLMEHGCALLREGGRHSWWQHSQAGRRSAIPRHGEINDHLARKICRDLGVSEP